MICFCSKSRQYDTDCKHCMLTTIKVYAYNAVKFTNTNKKSSNVDGGGGCTNHGSAFVVSPAETLNKCRIKWFARHVFMVTESF